MKKNLQNPTVSDTEDINVLTPAQRKAYATALGRLGGSKSTPAKTEAARKNGKLGGRPRKVLVKGEPTKS